MKKAEVICDKCGKIKDLNDYGARFKMVLNLPYGWYYIYDKDFCPKCGKIMKKGIDKVIDAETPTKKK